MTNDIYATGIRLWNDWTRMWNGEPALARSLVAPRFVLHLPPSPLDTRTITDGASVERWVIAHRARYKDLQFATQTGPFVDVTAGIVAGPWFADATLVDGQETRWAVGMDTIRFVDGKITEYWTISKEADEVGRWMPSPVS